MDERMDDLITKAAPPVPQTTAGDVLLREIIAETQVTAAARRLRTGRRRCLMASAVLVAVGAGVGVAVGSNLLLPTDPTADPSGRDALRVQVPMAPGRMCEVSFMATPSGGAAEARPHDAALTAARSFLRDLDPAVVSTAVGGGSTPYGEAAEVTDVAPNSWATRLGTASREIQAAVRDYVVSRGLRADNVRITSSAECRAANH